MKKYSLIFILLFSINSFAQEKQNDATWSETIEFIKNNITSLRGKTIWGSSNTSTLETTLSNGETMLTVKNYSHDYSFNDNRSFNLNDLGSVYLKSGDNYSYLMLWTREKGLVDCKIDEEVTTPCNFVEIGIDSKEMKERFFKAFKHLSYLAEEKQKIKKSKSKF